jgi:hypothetical protein
MKQQDVYLFVFDGLSDWEMGYAVAGINSPQFQLNPGNYRVHAGAEQLVQNLVFLQPRSAV